MATLKHAVEVMEGAQELAERINRLVGELGAIVLPLADAPGAQLTDPLSASEERLSEELRSLVLAADIQKLKRIAAVRTTSE